jgi:hypothetical protein
MIQTSTCQSVHYDQWEFFSHSILVKTQSNFSYVGISCLLAQVNCLPGIMISLRSSVSIIMLKINGQHALKFHYSSLLVADTKKVCQFVGTPSSEWCSKRIFPTRVTRCLISNSWGTVEKASLVLVKQPAK